MNDTALNKLHRYDIEQLGYLRFADLLISFGLGLNLLRNHCLRLFLNVFRKDVTTADLWLFVRSCSRFRLVRLSLWWICLLSHDCLECIDSCLSRLEVEFKLISVDTLTTLGAI